MDRELTWHELARVIEAHEEYHNHRVLAAFCKRYFPGATRITVRATQEYDDNTYYFSFGPSNISVYVGDKEVELPDDEVSLLVLLAQSESLKQELKEAKPVDPLLWLADLYYDEVYDLELCGIEKGYDVEVDVTSAPPLPPKVFVKEGEDGALPADGHKL